jgi:hypothetical protein
MFTTVLSLGSRLTDQEDQYGPHILSKERVFEYRGSLNLFFIVAAITWTPPRFSSGRMFWMAI